MGEKDNHTSNGLLLRADLHTLLDCGLIGIEPHKLIVRLHSRILTEYRQFEGVRLRVREGAAEPSKEALFMRWESFLERDSSN